jgi:hypothetical protein
VARGAGTIATWTSSPQQTTCALIDYFDARMVVDVAAKGPTKATVITRRLR